MKLAILLFLLAAVVCAFDDERFSNAGQLADNVHLRKERSVAFNEFYWRRQRNSRFKSYRSCCPVGPTSCCQCCQQPSSTTLRSRTTVPSRPITTEPFTVAPPNENPVQPVGKQNFTEIVINSEKYWIVVFTFSGPACSYCQRLIPIIKDLSELLQGYSEVHLGIFDANYGDHRTYLADIGITEFPTVYIYANDKEHPYDYGTPKTANDLLKSTLYLITRPKVAVGTCAIDSEPFPTSDVCELIDSNFQETVESCTEAWVVHFYLASPKVCTEFFSFFEEAAKELKDRVKFGAFYQSKKAITPATYGANTKACWVKMFPKGEKGHCVLDFNEGNHSQELDQTLLSWVERYLDDEAVQEVCEGVTTPFIEPETEPEEITTKPTPRPRPPTTTTRKPTTTTTRRPTTTTRRSTTTTTRKPTTTTTRKPTTTTTRRPTTTTTRRPTTTTTRRPTTTTTRKPTTTTTRRPSTMSTTRRRITTTTQKPWLRSSTTRRRPIVNTYTTPIPPTRRPTTVGGVTIHYPASIAPGTEPQELPETGVNDDWCQYRCCIIYFLPQQTRCELACYKNYITTLVRVTERHSAGCMLYFEYQGQRLDFERTFAVFQFPRIVVVTTETHTFTSRDGTVSESILDQYIDAYVQGKLQMKRIPIYVSPPCENEAC